MSEPISEAKFSVSSPAAEDVVSKFAEDPSPSLALDDSSRSWNRSMIVPQRESKRISNVTGDKASPRNQSCTKKDKRFHNELGGLSDFAFLGAAVCNKLRCRADEAEEDRGQSKDDEDRLEDEDEDLRAGTKNQHGISYANSEEELTRDECDGIGHPEPSGGITAGSQTRTRLK
ncbi:hypothetical protein C8J55DRAFT_554501 [Lentinula edodes]|uniref:Uncharacterized protein n=1 Tax=Lentinula lateritia TaxID=40482 RepID=A0A9W9E1G6_9AGAR|nr:hypothetical protein C8J55DRAFT_554501 [Lentinula edodes]